MDHKLECYIHRHCNYSDRNIGNASAQVKKNQFIMEDRCEVQSLTFLLTPSLRQPSPFALPWRPCWFCPLNSSLSSSQLMLVHPWRHGSFFPQDVHLFLHWLSWCLPTVCPMACYPFCSMVLFTVGNYLFLSQSFPLDQEFLECRDCLLSLFPGFPQLNGYI